MTNDTMIEAKTARETKIESATEIESERGSRIRIAPRDWCDTARLALPVAGIDTGSGGDGTLGWACTVGEPDALSRVVSHD